MKKIGLFLILLAASPCFGQKEPFFVYREYNLKPPYGASRIQQMIADSAIHPGYSHILPDRLYASLSLREKFTYNKSSYRNAVPFSYADQDLIFRLSGEFYKQSKPL